MKAQTPTQVRPNPAVIGLGGADQVSKGLLGFSVELVLLALRAGGDDQLSSSPGEGMSTG